jgi:hypothetical protein
MNAFAAAVDVTRYAQEYERLRSQIGPALLHRAFEPATPPARAIGLALLLREGMPAWIRAVRQVSSEAASSPAGIGSPASTPRAPSSPVLAVSADGSGAATSTSTLIETGRQRDLTSLLASLVLSARRTTEAKSMKEHSPCH